MKRTFFLTSCLLGVTLLPLTLSAAELPNKYRGRPFKDLRQAPKESAFFERVSCGCGCGGGGGEGKSNEIPPDKHL